MNNLLKNKLKTDYENLTESTSASLWGKINNRLENEKVEKKIFVLPNFWKYAAAVLLLISVGFVMKFINSNFTDQTSEKKAIVSSQEKKNSDEKTSFDANNNISQKVEIAKTKRVETIQEHTSPDLVHSTKTDTRATIKSETPIISIDQAQKENNAIALTSTSKETLSAKVVPNEKTKYVTASELLFEREANKTLQNQNETMVTAELLQKPKQIKILGFTVYTDSQQ